MSLLLFTLWPGLTWKIVSVLLFAGFILAAVLRTTAAMLAPVALPAGSDKPALPRYTVLVPLYREAGMIPQIMSAMSALDYPVDRLQILLVCEADDGETLAAIHALRVLAPFDLFIAPPGFPRTKPRACNAAMETATGEFVVIYDAEDRPDPRQLREAAGRFAAEGRRLACLQAPLRIDHGRGFFARQFALEYALQFEVMIPALQRLGLGFPLGGTSNHFRASVLRQVGLWDPYNVTEDADLGMRLTARGYRLGALQSPTWEAPTARFADWLPQRTRWTKGFIQTWMVHMRSPLAGGWRKLLTLQATVGVSIASALVHGPIALAIIVQIGLMLSGRGRNPFHYADLTLLCVGVVATTIGYTVGARRANFPIRSTDILLAPLYWPLLSWAAGRALHQLIVRPFHWEKTPHQPVAAPSLDEAPPQRVIGTHEEPVHRRAPHRGAYPRLERLRADRQRPWPKAGTLRTLSRRPARAPVPVGAPRRRLGAGRDLRPDPGG